MSPTSDQPSRNDFAGRMLEELARLEPDVVLEYEVEPFRLRQEGDARFYFHLSNAFQEYCKAGDEEGRAEVLRRYCGAWLARDRERPTAPKPPLAELRPCLRLRSYFELTRLRFRNQQGELPPPFPYRVVGDHYALGLMQIEEGSLQIVAQHHLEEWGLDFETALDAAVDNLRGVSAEPFRRNADGVWFGYWKDDFGPSRLVFPERIRSECAVQGDQVILPAERRVLLVVGSEEEDQLRAAVLLAEELAKDGRSVGKLPLRLRENGDWLPFLPSGRTEAGAEVRRRWLESLADSYRQQAAFLEEAKEEDGPAAEGCHVFPGRDDVPPFSFCIWTEGADAWLPRTEQILFAVPDAARREPVVRAQVSWERAAALVGNLMEPVPDLYPERFRMRGFPDAEQLAALRAASGR